MSLYLEQIRQLVALQRVDDAIHSVEMELEQAPKELEDLKNRFVATNTQRERVLEKLAHLKEQEKRITGELDDDSSRIKKSKNKMMQVSNSREYQAMAREMDNMEKVNRSREEERAALLEEKLHQDNALQEVDAIWADLKAELEAKQKSLEENLALLERSERRWAALSEKIGSWEEEENISNQTIWDIDKFRKGTISGEELGPEF